MEQRREVKTIQVLMMCDACGGEMAFDGRLTSTHPPTYRHRCSKCAREEYYPKFYPNLEYDATSPQVGGGQ